LAKLQKDPSGNYPAQHIKTVSEQDPELDLTLETYDQENPGFLKIIVTKTELTVEAYAVPFSEGFTNAPTDSVSVSIGGNLILINSSSAAAGGATSRHRGARRGGNR
jgi:hypothetical protein